MSWWLWRRIAACFFGFAVSAFSGNDSLAVQSLLLLSPAWAIQLWPRSAVECIVLAEWVRMVYWLRAARFAWVHGGAWLLPTAASLAASFG